MRSELAAEAAALQLAEAHGLPTPRLVASDLDGKVAGCIAVLTTHLEGSDQIPRSLNPDRLRATGAAAAVARRLSRPRNRRHSWQRWMPASAERALAKMSDATRPLLASRNSA
jgi:hypothetical protein